MLLLLKEEKCKFNKFVVVVKVKGYKDFLKLEESLMVVVVMVGLIFVVLDVFYLLF